MGNQVQAACLQLMKLPDRSLFMCKIPVRLTSILASVLILLATSSAAAEVYSWTDENGQKHFGDKIPLEYQEQSKRVDLNIQHPSEEAVRAAAQMNSNIGHQLGASVNEGETKPVKKKEKQEQPSKSYDEMTYEEQVAAYKKSEACYTGCAGAPTYPRRESYHYRPEDPSHHGDLGERDMSNCGHCTSIPKPRKR